MYCICSKSVIPHHQNYRNKQYHGNTILLLKDSTKELTSCSYRLLRLLLFYGLALGRCNSLDCKQPYIFLLLSAFSVKAKNNYVSVYTNT